MNFQKIFFILPLVMGVENTTHVMDDMESHESMTSSMSNNSTGPCQFQNSYPLYCTEMEAKEASPVGSAHEHGYHHSHEDEKRMLSSHVNGSFWMPDGVEMFHGDYDGSAAKCECNGEHIDHQSDHDHGDHDHESHDHGDHSHGGHDHDAETDHTSENGHHNSTHEHGGHDHSHGNHDHDGTHAEEACQFETSYPLYCTEMSAIAASPTGGAHSHAGLFMPNGVEMFHNGYDGDAKMCDCAETKHHGSHSGDDHNHGSHSGDDHHSHDGEHDHSIDANEMISLARLKYDISSGLLVSILILSIIV